jgi:hypothetical protein
VYRDHQPKQCDFNQEHEGGLVYDGYASNGHPYHDFATYQCNPNHYIVCLQIYNSLSPEKMDFVLKYSRHIYFKEPVPIIEEPLVLIPGLHTMETVKPDSAPAPVFHQTTIHPDGSITQENSLLTFQEHCDLLTRRKDIDVGQKRRLEIN